MNNIGKIIQVIGPVVDIRFEKGQLPALYSAIIVDEKGYHLTVEVAQHIGDDCVRCIAMSATDGLVRGMEALDTGAPISVPVGKEVLGRMFNVLGDPIDELGDLPEDVEKHPIHRAALPLRNNRHQQIF